MPTSSAPHAPVPAVELELELDTKYMLTMGWGHVWEAKVRRVVRGQLPDPVIELSTYDDPDLYGGHFACCAPETGLIVGFARLSKQPTSLQGFTAADGSIWQMVDIKR